MILCILICGTGCLCYACHIVRKMRIVFRSMGVFRRGLDALYWGFVRIFILKVFLIGLFDSIYIYTYFRKIPNIIYYKIITNQ